MYHHTQTYIIRGPLPTGRFCSTTRSCQSMAVMFSSKKVVSQNHTLVSMRPLCTGAKEYLLILPIASTDPKKTQPALRLFILCTMYTKNTPFLVLHRASLRTAYEKGRECSST